MLTENFLNDFYWDFVKNSRNYDGRNLSKSCTPRDQSNMCQSMFFSFAVCISSRTLTDIIFQGKESKNKRVPCYNHIWGTSYHNVFSILFSSVFVCYSWPTWTVPERYKCWKVNSWTDGLHQASLLQAPRSPASLFGWHGSGNGEGIIWTLANAWILLQFSPGLQPANWLFCFPHARIWPHFGHYYGFSQCLRTWPIWAWDV